MTLDHRDPGQGVALERVAAVAPDSTWPRRAWPLLIGARPRQWLKNGLVFLAFFFSVGEAWHVQDPGSWLPLLSRAVLASLAFCAVSSGGYLINDVIDVDRDRIHPVKKYRPIASGALSPRFAIAAADLFLPSDWTRQSVGVAVCFRLSGVWWNQPHIQCQTQTCCYPGSLYFGVRFCFAGRGWRGCYLGVRISPWLYLCTLLGALFLVMAKRRYELTMLDMDASRHRPTLSNYTVELLDQMIMIISASTVVSYAVYTVTASNVPTNGAMLATVPILLYGIFRYLYLSHRGGMGGSPEDVLLRDRPTQLTIALWIASSLVILALWRA